MLKGKKIILGVCGSIAAYKAALLVRQLIKEGAEVKVIMTPAASTFITSLTLGTLSKNPVYSDFVKNDNGEWNNHVDLGLWADLILIAPISAHTLAKLANGLCDNLLTAVYLSARCPVFIAPAMDLDMYKHPSTIANLKRLVSYGHTIIDARHGELASGLVGQGRMAEPEEILNYLTTFFQAKASLKNKKILITAGPTYEQIDPVRFIGNFSSGKMGYALAREAAERGGQVVLISGPSYEDIDHPQVELIKVTSAQEMHEQCMTCFPGCDIAILAAAVADYTPKEKFSQKLKKKKATLTIELEKTADIAKALQKIKKQTQIIVGFALETEDEEKNAIKKRKDKGFDLIVLNSLNDKGAGFGYDTNKITLIDKDNNISHFELKSKAEAAKDIIENIITISD